VWSSSRGWFALLRFAESRQSPSANRVLLNWRKEAASQERLMRHYLTARSFLGRHACMYGVNLMNLRWGPSSHPRAPGHSRESLTGTARLRLNRSGRLAEHSRNARSSAIAADPPIHRRCPAADGRRAEAARSWEKAPAPCTRCGAVVTRRRIEAKPARFPRPHVFYVDCFDCDQRPPEGSTLAHHGRMGPVTTRKRAALTATWSYREPVALLDQQAGRRVRRRRRRR
jgi:hypothetical protein